MDLQVSIFKKILEYMLSGSDNLPVFNLSIICRASTSTTSIHLWSFDTPSEISRSGVGKHIPSLIVKTEAKNVFHFSAISL